MSSASWNARHVPKNVHDVMEFLRVAKWIPTVRQPELCQFLGGAELPQQLHRLHPQLDFLVELGVGELLSTPLQARARA